MFNIYGNWEQDFLDFLSANWKTFWEAVESSSNSTPVILSDEIGAILSIVLADATLAQDLIHVFA